MRIEKVEIMVPTIVLVGTCDSCGGVASTADIEPSMLAHQYGCAPFSRAYVPPGWIYVRIQASTGLDTSSVHCSRACAIVAMGG